MALVNLRCLSSHGADASANQAAIRTNLDRHLYFVDRVTAEGAEFVGFPELSLNGYWYSQTMIWLKLDGPEVRTLAKKAIEKGVYIAAGMAEQDAAGKRWNTHFVLGPNGQIVGWHHKLWLTDDKAFAEAGTDHNVFDVKGLKMGITTCADGSNYANLKALADNGAQLIYGPHANTTGSTIAGWYKFRARWGGKWDGKMVPADPKSPDPQAQWPTGGWCHQLKVYAALHNHAAYYNPAFDPPPGPNTPLKGWASGAWFIGPDGATLNQMPTSTQRTDSKEWVLMFNVPTAKNAPPATPDPALAQAAISASTSPAAAAASTSFTAPGGAADEVNFAVLSWGP
jgi:hypothetical protein